MTRHLAAGVLAAILVLSAGTAAADPAPFSPADLAVWHRANNPTGPYRVEVCRTPAEADGVHWSCPGRLVEQLRRESWRIRLRLARQADAGACVPGRWVPDGCYSRPPDGDVAGR